MKCVKCGGDTFPSTTSKAVELDGGVLVIRNIPCYKCNDCDEIFYTGDVVKAMEGLIATAREQMQEIAVIDFAKAA